MNHLKHFFQNKTTLGSFLLGIGLTGMLDGIIFHQILQWHSTYMFTNRFYQIVSDGLFHLFVTVIIFWGALILWKSNPNDQKSHKGFFISGLFLGGGSFNFVEGIVDHHILQIHHVRPGEYQQLYDLGYDAVAVLMIVIGLLFFRSSIKKSRS